MLFNIINPAHVSNNAIVKMLIVDSLNFKKNN